MSLLIYIISFLEGFTTLSIEIIAIRNFTPIIGTNSISTSVILGVILLALSYGYYIGGKNTKGKSKKELINKIIKNLSISSLYYLLFTFTLDHIILTLFLEYSGSYFGSILLSSFILFFIPIFLASQTIPLLSEILKGDNTGEKIGKLLFFSTIGSFLGSVLTSSLLFPILGVEKSAIFNSFILAVIVVILTLKNFKEFNIYKAIGLGIFIISIVKIIGNENIGQNLIYKTSNSYHDIVIYNNTGNQRFFSLNEGYSSGIDLYTNESFFKYIKEIKKQITNSEDKNILVIGAAGFTLPNELSKYTYIENIDVVDVDSSLKDISEEYFLGQELSEKIKFYPEPSRFFINNSIKKGLKYDSIVIDVYVGKSLAPQTLTYEFFRDLNKIGDSIYLNIITDSKLNSNFSKKVLNTINKGFGKLYYFDVNNGKYERTNFVMTNKKYEGYSEFLFKEGIDIYTDNKNSIEVDLFNSKQK